MMNEREACPFCNIEQNRLIYEDDLIIAFWDVYPVSPGHALLIPKRHVAAWFDASEEEQIHLLQGVNRVREIIEERHSPAGFNIGVNVGQAAGQTVFHLHLHVIPRYDGDTPDPTGGVRHVIPGKGNYRRGGVCWEPAWGCTASSSPNPWLGRSPMREAGGWVLTRPASLVPTRVVWTHGY